MENALRHIGSSALSITAGRDWKHLLLHAVLALAATFLLSSSFFSCDEQVDEGGGNNAPSHPRLSVLPVQRR